MCKFANDLLYMIEKVYLFSYSAQAESIFAAITVNNIDRFWHLKGRAVIWELYYDPLQSFKYGQLKLQTNNLNYEHIAIVFTQVTCTRRESDAS